MVAFNSQQRYICKHMVSFYVPIKPQPQQTSKSTGILKSTSFKLNIIFVLPFHLTLLLFFSDVNYLSTTAPPSASEWCSYLRPLRGREPEGMWNLLSIGKTKAPTLYQVLRCISTMHSTSHSFTSRSVMMQFVSDCFLHYYIVYSLN